MPWIASKGTVEDNLSEIMEVNSWVKRVLGILYMIYDPVDLLNPLQ